MLRIVLPVAVAVCRPVGCPIEILITVNVGVAVPYEVVVVIYVDVIVATPSTVIAPATTPSGAHCDSDCERNCHARGVMPNWRISNWRVWIHRCSIYNGRVVTRNIDHLWIGLLNDNNLFALDYFCFHFLLLRGL